MEIYWNIVLFMHTIQLTSHTVVVNKFIKNIYRHIINILWTPCKCDLFIDSFLINNNSFCCHTSRENQQNFFLSFYRKGFGMPRLVACFKILHLAERKLRRRWEDDIKTEFQEFGWGEHGLEYYCLGHG